MEEGAVGGSAVAGGGVWEPAVAVSGGLRSEWWWLGESSEMWRVGGVRGALVGQVKVMGRKGEK